MPYLINENIPQQERLLKLNQIAIQQMKVLQEVENRRLLTKVSELLKS